MRRRDFARLDATGQVYLDFTGAGLYADSQVAEHVVIESGQRPCDSEYFCRGAPGM